MRYKQEMESGFTLFPLSVGELQESPAFLSPVASVVRAAMFMRAEAFSRRGSLPAGFAALALVCRMTEAEVEEHFALLTHGWELRADGRLHLPHISEAAESLEERFGDQLAVLSDSMFLAVGAKEEFELVPQDVVKARKVRRNHALPVDFAPDAASLQWMHSYGFVDEEARRWLIARMRDIFQGKLKTDWQATLRNLASSDRTQREVRAWRESQVLLRVGGGQISPAAARLKMVSGSAAEVRREQNRGSIEGAMARHFGASSSIDEMSPGVRT